ncbi:Smr/MutS family protein [Bordetella trematum]|uniref:Smr/MutS family protein n=1 Tax=Bordetella trematum TaxID=123899 RepID=UPI000D9EE001|nr:Smr/MutS family protein [Bordetella trematum]SPU53251.1 Probable DNA endonuclease SmrA [Bordetella trematum]VDH09026.1 Probable DNA endonuclease SmrA [Bordetella trematum]
MRGTKLGLADLKRLQKSVQEQRAQAQRQAREAARQQAVAIDDSEAFRRAVAAATPLKARATVVHAPPAAAGSLAIAQRRAHATGDALSARADQGVSDGGDIAPLLSEGGTAFVRHDAAPDTARNLKRGQWRIGAELDLHGLRVEQARHAVIVFLDECLEHGIRCLRIVHGKGYGSQGLEPVLKDKVRTWLIQKAEVMAFSEAPERGGGAGALLVLLRSETSP